MVLTACCWVERRRRAVCRCWWRRAGRGHLRCGRDGAGWNGRGQRDVHLGGRRQNGLSSGGTSPDGESPDPERWDGEHWTGWARDGLNWDGQDWDGLNWNGQNRNGRGRESLQCGGWADGRGRSRRLEGFRAVEELDD